MPRITGFTLIELAVSMAIIGILVGAATFNFTQSVRNGYIGQAYTIRGQLDSGLVMYAMNTGGGTTDFSDFVTTGLIPAGSNLTVSLSGNEQCTQTAIGPQIVCEYSDWGMSFDVTFSFSGNGTIQDDIPTI